MDKKDKQDTDISLLDFVLSLAFKCFIQACILYMVILLIKNLMS